MEEIKTKVDEIKSSGTKAIKVVRRKAPYLVIMLFSIALTGLMELMVYGWSLDNILSANFWANMFTTNLSAFLMAIGSTLMSADTISQITTYGLGKQAFDLEQAVIIASANVKNDIDLFIYEENLKRKEKAFRETIHKKIIKVENHFKTKDTNSYAYYLKHLENYDVKLLTKRVKQKVKLEKLLDDNYIKEHIEYIKVKFNKITRRMIENGTDLKIDDGTLTRKSKVLMSGIIPKFILSMSFTIFITSFAPELKKGITWVIIIPILTKLITLLFNYIYGRDFAPDYFNSTTINNLQVRRQWLTKYNEWKVNQVKEQVINNEHQVEKLKEIAI